ncbi:MAG: chromate transporter, partial [Angustibacter sp.]
MSSPTGPVVNLVPIREAARTWWGISWQTFGGPAGQISVMHRILVEQKRWIGEQRFMYALNYCMLLPGPEAQQLAIYVGWLLNGVRGGLIAGATFVFPGLITLLALSALYVRAGDTPVVSAVFTALSAAVFAIVVQAVWRVAGRALTCRPLKAVALSSFIALGILGLPFPAVIALAALIGWYLGRSGKIPMTPARSPANGLAPLVSDSALSQATPGPWRSLRVLVIGLVLWLGPVLLVAGYLGGEHILVDQAKFFSGAALVTFGGAYAVLAYVAQRAVETYG